MKKLSTMLGFDKESGKVTLDGVPIGEPVTLTIQISDGEIAVVPPFDFAAEARQTLSPAWHGGKVAKHELVGALNTAITALAQLDKVKKTLFYGRDNNLDPREGQANVINLPRLIQDTQRQHYGIEMTLDAVYNVIHGAIGYATEAGEMLEMLRDVMNGKKLDSVNVMEECGDGKWYMAILLDTLGFEWGDDEKRVIAKLRARFPDKFTEYDANNRNLAAERTILEGDAANQLALPIAERDALLPGGENHIDDTARARFEANSGGMLSGADTN
ncbi:hypothetical protein UFOVP131_23 [uncultured Caudovirales phage]|uniref:NTP pyrophosphohydrolase MazG putative catalytic core domain-containing protein n=1 Tax=uncultured Caudovirales phage TaxID=2100421 RepID=A0A6J5LDV6_9CAUD|nr:hypothetical protein UFOVP131_23 [uncultured Caudovirales phage]